MDMDVTQAGGTPRFTGCIGYAAQARHWHSQEHDCRAAANGRCCVRAVLFRNLLGVRLTSRGDLPNRAGLFPCVGSAVERPACLRAEQVPIQVSPPWGVSRRSVCELQA